MPRIELMVGLAKPRPTLPDLDLSFQNGGCHAHGFAWAWSEPNRHAHAKPWAWHPFITHHFRTEGLVGWVESSRPNITTKRANGGPRKASAHPTKPRSIRDIGQVILVLLPGRELLAHQLLLLRRQAVDLLLLIRQLLQIGLIDLRFLRGLTQVLANPVLVRVQTVQVGYHLGQLTLGDVPSALQTQSLGQLLLQARAGFGQVDEVANLPFRAVGQ